MHAAAGRSRTEGPTLCGPPAQSGASARHSDPSDFGRRIGPGQWWPGPSSTFCRSTHDPDQRSKSEVKKLTRGCGAIWSGVFVLKNENAPPQKSCTFASARYVHHDWYASPRRPRFPVCKKRSSAYFRMSTPPRPDRERASEPAAPRAAGRRPRLDGPISAQRTGIGRAARCIEEC